MAQKWHPDNFSNEQEKKNAEKKFVDIAAAKEVYALELYINWLSSLHLHIGCFRTDESSSMKISFLIQGKDREQDKKVELETAECVGSRLSFFCLVCEIEPGVVVLGNGWIVSKNSGVGSWAASFPLLITRQRVVIKRSSCSFER